jgi:hypothetical protein
MAVFDNDTVMIGGTTKQFILDFSDTTLTTSINPPITNKSFFKIFPNPSKGELKIEAPDENYEVRVSNLEGKKLLSKKLSGSATLDLSAIRAKTVVVEIYVKGKKVQAEKIVIQ